MKNIILMISAFLASGCTLLPHLNQSNTSYVAAEINNGEIEEVGIDMAKFLASQLPAAKTTLSLEPSKTLFQQVLMGELAELGFGITTTQNPEQQAVPLSYFVTTLDGGILVRMKYGDRVAGRYYSRTTEGLSFASAFSVMEVAK